MAICIYMSSYNTQFPCHFIIITQTPGRLDMYVNTVLYLYESTSKMVVLLVILLQDPWHVQIACQQILQDIDFTPPPPFTDTF